MRTWRLLDTPPMSAADNMCLDEVLAEVKGRGHAPDTLRYLQFKPRAVLVGYHQSVAEESRLDYCREHGIEVNRRTTGGGAIFFDENQLGWEVYADKAFFGLSLPTLPLFKRLCLPVTTALAHLGIPDARFRPRNDIEINGRKISGTGGAESGQAFMFQGTMLVDFDVQTMLRALRIPVEKLKAKEVDSVRDRVTCLNWELGRTPSLTAIKEAIQKGFEAHLGIHLEPSGLTPEEEELFQQRREYFHSDAWINKVNPRNEIRETVQANYKSSEGMVRFSLAVDLAANRLRDVYITGDFLTFPGRALYDLEAELRGRKIDRDALHETIEGYFASGTLTIPGMDFKDFVKPLDLALEKVAIARLGISLKHANRISVTNGSFQEVLAKEPSVLLLPYCAKHTGCDLRHAPGCRACGQESCTVGDAWLKGRRLKLRTRTIVSFEDLMEELERMKRRGEKAFIGLCCQPFFAKHMDDFMAAGIPGILIDIDDTTCYDLDQAKDAYAGTFDNQTTLDLELLDSVLDAAARTRTACADRPA